MNEENEETLQQFSHPELLPENLPSDSLSSNLAQDERAKKYDLGGTEINVVEAGSIPVKDIVEILKDVIDPELGINVVDLGLLYGIRIAENNELRLDMTLTSVACPLTDVIERQIQFVLSAMVPLVEINWVWLPPWTSEFITEEGKQQLRAIGFNI